MEETGSFTYANKIMEEYKIKISLQIKELGGNKILEKLIHFLETNQI